MPMQVEYTIPASQVRKGDLLFGHEVIEKDNARTRTHLTVRIDNNDFESREKKHSFGQEDQLAVVRTEKTPEEKAAETAAYTEQLVQQVMRSLRSAAESNPLIEWANRVAIDKGYAKSPLAGLGWHGEDLFMQAAAFEFAELALMKEEDLTDEEVVLRAAKLARNMQVQDADRFGSRSTSMFSNLAEDAKRVYAARWLKESTVSWCLARLEKEDDSE